MDFSGTKLICLVGRRLVTLRRDCDPSIPWPGYWDLPGGGRDGDESPVACVLRETAEEVGLTLTPNDLVWRRFYPHPVAAWFFAARLPESAAADLSLGDEGQALALVDPAEWVLREDVIPHFRMRVAFAMEELHDL